MHANYNNKKFKKRHLNSDSLYIKKPGLCIIFSDLNSMTETDGDLTCEENCNSNLGCVAYSLSKDNEICYLHDLFKS